MSYSDLISRLRCPEDHSELDHVPDKVLVCKSCGRAFPIHEGIPVMLLDDRVQVEGKRLADEAKREGLLGAPAEPPSADSAAEADGGA